MNFGVVVSALTYAMKHRKELAADAECAIHLIRRIEHTVVKHRTTADDVLVAADKALTRYSDVEEN